MTTKEMIHTYARFLRQAERWQTQANAVRDKIAERIQREGNFRNGSRATRYQVKDTRVRAHNRGGYAAMRITV